MKTTASIRILSSLLILLFTYAATSKLAQYHLFVLQLQAFPFIGAVAPLLAWLIPLGELLTVAFLFLPALQNVGFYASAVLLVLFTAFLILMVDFDGHLPCSCGGVIAQLSWKEHIVFNLGFLVISVAGIYFKQSEKRI